MAQGLLAHEITLHGVAVSGSFQVVNMRILGSWWKHVRGYGIPLALMRAGALTSTAPVGSVPAWGDAGDRYAPPYA